MPGSANYFSSRSETRWIFTEEIDRYKCECLNTIKKVFIDDLVKKTKKIIKKIWSQSARVASFGIGILQKSKKKSNF